MHNKGKNTRCHKIDAPPHSNMIKIYYWDKRNGVHLDYVL